MAKHTLSGLRKEIRRISDPKRARTVMGFFKTGPGQYSEGDIFVGIITADIRKLAARFENLPKKELSKLLSSKIHEERLIALFILADLFEKADEKGRRFFYSFYLKHLNFVNNWDLVDLSAASIAGDWLEKRSKGQLDRWASSKNLWHRRVAVVSTHWLIRKKKFAQTLRLVKKLRKDKEDLIHKACGWMLREVGKRDIRVLERFLEAERHELPRTTLRYAIERFPKERRLYYLRRLEPRPKTR